MFDYDIVPCERVGPICFGMLRSEARQIMKQSGAELEDYHDNEWGCTDYFLEANFQISYGKDTGTVAGVGVCPTRSMRASFRGKNLLDLSSKKLYRHLLKYEESEMPEYDYMGATFPTLQMSLHLAQRQNDWRVLFKRKMFQAIYIGDKPSIEYMLDSEA